MPDRFYCPGNWGAAVDLPETEAHHLSRVLRAEVGDPVELFDGHGKSGQGRIQSVGKKSVRVEIVSVDSEPTRTSTRVIASAVPKGERLDWMIEKLTELGADCWIPLQTERSVVEPRAQKLQKLSQTVITACKQCRRSTLLEIGDLCSLAELPNRIPLDQFTLWVGDADAAAALPRANPATSQLAIVGPEGGLTQSERELVRSWNAEPISLSPHILRTETAAIAFAGFFALSPSA
ncbi:RsmE family RNA methyltransferase [Planctomicrobium sp. SH664]|uniref:RsmE family RNA methyltransferase n=1 Tax=Planctomicrobium sp. SH664 TaxID=3448125 RepID=UPI003F5B3BB4